MVARGRSYVKKNNETGVGYWKSENIGHIKYKCLDEAASEKSFGSNARNVSLIVGDDDHLWKLRSVFSWQFYCHGTGRAIVSGLTHGHIAKCVVRLRGSLKNFLQI